MNRFIKEIFDREGFNEKPSEYNSMNYDLKKVFPPKNLMIIKTNSSFSKDKNYIGYFKISRIIYHNDKAIVIFHSPLGFAENGIHILKKENGIWTEDYGLGIPLRYNNEEIKF